MSRVKLFDSTLRDGSHAIKHQLTKENIINYCKAIDGVGMNTVIVGHGNGLGASSLQVGISLLRDTEMLKTARANLKQTRLGVYMIPGFGTIKDDLVPAIECGVDVFKIGCHCTEADTTKQHIEYLRKSNKYVYGVLMMYHMASPDRILEEAKKMESYGAYGVILMDSAGASTLENVHETVNLLCKNLDINVGFHPHNNMGLAVANAYSAVIAGATIIDGTLTGFGAGAGNCQLEALQALLEKRGIITGANLYGMLDVCDNVMPEINKTKNPIDSLSIVSGQAGVFSAFKFHVQKAAKEFNVDPREILVELGRRKAVGGQEDMIIEIAQKLNNPCGGFSATDYQIGALL